MTKLIVFAALALAIPAAAIADNTAPPTVQAAAKAACRTERTAIGDAAFKLLHGANGFGKCVSGAVRSAKANDAAALNTCKKDQSDPAFAAAHGGKTFAQFYGKNSSGANALGKCVSATSSEPTMPCWPRRLPPPSRVRQSGPIVPRSRPSTARTRTRSASASLRRSRRRRRRNSSSVPGRALRRPP